MSLLLIVVVVVDVVVVEIIVFVLHNMKTTSPSLLKLPLWR